MQIADKSSDAQTKLIIKGTADQIASALVEIEDFIQGYLAAEEKLASNLLLKSPRGKSPSKSPPSNDTVEPDLTIANPVALGIKLYSYVRRNFLNQAP